ncbi:Thioredoxin Asp [Paramyrothecium foliicola]|nr:Thioredoxin Asp [Paramyrothecium foliicola]
MSSTMVFTARSLRAGSALARASRAPTVGFARQFHASPSRLEVHSINRYANDVSLRRKATSPPRANCTGLYSKEEFAEALKKPAVLVDCLAEWCGPCKAMSPILSKLSNDAQNKGIHFVQFDVDQLPELTQELGVRAMPTFMIFKDGKKVDELVGANPPKLAELLAKYRP